MADEQVTAFDFRKPSQLSLLAENRFLRWQQSGFRLLAEQWEDLLTFAVSLEPLPPETTVTSEVELPEAATVFRVSFETHAPSTILVIPAPLAVALVKGVLGESVEQLPGERPLTSIETAVLESAIQQLLDCLNVVAGSFALTACSLTGHEADPQMLRLFPCNADLVLLRQRARAPFGEADMWWIWPEALVEKLLPPDDALTETSTHTSAALKEVAQRIPFQVRVRLGAATLDIADLARLSVGDVIVLDQRVCEPLDCAADGALLMKGWPGSSGNRQAIQIAEMRPAG